MQSRNKQSRYEMRSALTIAGLGIRNQGKSPFERHLRHDLSSLIEHSIGTDGDGLQAGFSDFIKSTIEIGE
jgi:hypothetical protein